MKQVENVLYQGAVNFSHSLIWICILCITFSAIYFALPPLIEVSAGDFVFPSIVAISAISFAIGLALPILLLAIKLRIQVRKDGIYLKIIPFQFSYRRIPFDDLVNCERYEYSQKDVNGLGLRNTIAGSAYALGGKRGIKLEFANRKKLFVESRRPEKIIDVIKTINTMSG